MTIPLSTEQRFCKEVTLLAAETTHTNLTAAAAETIVVTYASIMVILGAAQTVYVGDECGTNRILSVAASLATFAPHFVGPLVEGVHLVKGEDLIIKPAAAGPEIHVVCEGYILRA